MPRSLTSLLASLCMGLPFGCGNAPAASATSAAGLGCPGTLPSCPTPPPAYAAVAPIIAGRCAPCHLAGGVADAKHDLGSYAAVYAQRATVLDQVHACLMPPSDAPPLSDAEYATLTTWLACDAPQ